MLTNLASLILQLSKTEARIALRQPRAVDRLDMALDLFAIKAIPITVDVDVLRELIQQCTSERDRVAHGVWLRHPETSELYLRIARGNWPKNMTRGEKISRAVFPQSLPYGKDDCLKSVDKTEKALSMVNYLGEALDHALMTFPERFRPPSPVLNPLGLRSRKGKPPRP